MQRLVVITPPTYDDSNTEQEEFDSFLCREHLNLHSSGASLEYFHLCS